MHASRQRLAARLATSRRSNPGVLHALAQLHPGAVLERQAVFQGFSNV